ncbi:MAG: AbrB/MazE/SpoVT family DNA-binding domain-containing protein [Promethearchaeota archaeon]
MGTVEIDERGRLTIPASIRRDMGLKAGDSLSIETTPDEIILRKHPSKEKFFQVLVGCITTPSTQPVTPESIKSIWKQNP